MSEPPERFAIVRATFYEDLAQRLTAGALKGFEEEGIDERGVDVFDVPGAFELPLAAKACAESGRYAGVACLGAVIRGETDHYDWVCAAAAHGIELVQLETGVPVRLRRADGREPRPGPGPLRRRQARPGLQRGPRGRPNGPPGRPPAAAP